MVKKGKLKENYNLAKPNLKREKKDADKQLELKQMQEYLERTWRHPVSYKCTNCLRTAYLNQINDANGYISEDDLYQRQLKYRKLFHKVEF
jgi:hypothetical protein